MSKKPTRAEQAEAAGTLPTARRIAGHVAPAPPPVAAAPVKVPHAATGSTGRFKAKNPDSTQRQLFVPNTAYNDVKKLKVDIDAQEGRAVSLHNILVAAVLLGVQQLKENSQMALALIGGLPNDAPYAVPAAQ